MRALGYHAWAYQLGAMVVSGAFAGLAGAQWQPVARPAAIIGMQKALTISTRRQLGEKDEFEAMIRDPRIWKLGIGTKVCAGGPDEQVIEV